MGKKKNKQGNAASSNQKSEKESKAQKSYSFAAPGVEGKPAGDGDKLVKVGLTADREASVVSLIQDYKAQYTLRGKASLRLSNKKLMDVYNSLCHTGFRHNQIEQAMTNNIEYGGDLIDILDWLCLNTPNDQLPEGFSQTLCEEENRRRPRFAETPVGAQALQAHTAASAAAAAAHVPLPQPDTSSCQPLQPAHIEEEGREGAMKSWILQYAAQSSGEEDEEDLAEDGKTTSDPNETYLELTAKLLEARAQAAEAKQDGNNALQKQAGKLIRDYSQAMAKLEEHPDFREEVKIKGVELEMAAMSSRPAKVKKAKQVEPSLDQDMTSCDTAGLAMFEEQAAAEKPKPAPKVASKPLDKRCFEYTRQQWTGKSPKQFLIDWIRKHLPKSPPPSFEKVPVRGNLWKSKCKVKQGDVPLVVCPEIVCENLKEAEHLSCTLALYHLCKGQRVYQLLPPPYRDVWLEWQAAEDQAKQDVKEQQNKPRDQLIARLMKKVKSSTVSEETPENQEGEEEVEESWEDLLSDEEESSSQDKCERKPNKKLLDPSQAQKVFSKKKKVPTATLR